MIVRELFTLARSVHEDRTMPLFRTQQWYFFFISTVYMYGKCASRPPTVAAQPHARELLQGCMRTADHDQSGHCQSTLTMTDCPASR